MQLASSIRCCVPDTSGSLASGEEPVLVLVRWHRLELWLCRELWVHIFSAAGERQLALWLCLAPCPVALSALEAAFAVTAVTVTVSLKLSIDGRYH